MSTSPHQGIMLYDPADLETDESVGTARVRDEIVGSALHLADEAAQPRASWMAPAGEYLEIRENIDPDSAIKLNQWYAFPGRVLFAAKVRANGSGYRLRVRIAGASSDGNAVDFGLLVAARPASLRSFAFVLVTASDVTGTADWLTLDGGASYVDVPASVISSALDRPWTPTFTDIGGETISVQTAELELIFLGRTGTAGEPQLIGYDVAEYIGP